MTLKLKPDNGLALNQNIVLEHFYKSHYPHEYQSDYDRGYYPASKLEHYKLTQKQLTKAFRKLTARGYLKYSNEKRCYCPTKKGFEAVQNNDYIRSGPMGPHAGIRRPPPNTLSSYVWAALRAKNSASVEQLISIMPIEEKDYDKSFKSTRRLLYWLCKASIVRRLPRKQAGIHFNSRGHTRYQLVIDFGPKHPIIRQRKHQVYDPNSGTNVPFKEVLTVFKDRFK